MFLNLFLGLIIPFFMSFYLFYKNKKIVILIAPISSVICFIIINAEEHFGFWNLYPFNIHDAFAAIPYCIGLYPFNVCFFMYLIDNKFNHLNHSVLILALSAFTTFEEFCGILAGRIYYSNGWNIIFTFISYLVPFSVIYLYYRYLKKIQML